MTAWTETHVTKLNPRSVAATVSRLTGTWAAKGVKVRAVIDHSEQARAAGWFPSPAGDLLEEDPAGAADDAAAVEELFKTVYPKLAGWVRRLVDDDDTAHDIASEAFVRLLSRWTRVDSPQSYVYTIAANLTRDHWRKTERERRAIRSVTAGTAADPVTYPDQDVDVRSLIASLPPRLGDPFLLHYYGGYGTREVAELLRKPQGTIKADLFMARARLKTALAERVPATSRRNLRCCVTIPATWRSTQPPTSGYGSPGSRATRLGCSAHAGLCRRRPDDGSD